MLLGNPHAGVAEQDRNALDRRARFQQFDRERIPQAMGVPVFHSGVFEEFGERRTPFLASRLKRADSCPKPIALTEQRKRLSAVQARIL